MNNQFESLSQFKRGRSSKQGLDVGEFKNQIDWDNLPKFGLYRVLTGDENYMDECFVYITDNQEILMIKNWDDNGGEWARSWNDDDTIIGGTFEEFLKSNDAFNIIPFYPVNTDKFPPGWDAIAPF